jgi:hypothetical protein
MRCENSNSNEMLQHLLESKPIEEYEGCTFKEIHYLIYDPYCKNSPLSLAETIDSEILNKIPFFNLVKYFLDLVEQTQPIKINSNGYLPLRIIQTIYDQHFITEDFDDVHETKIIRRSRSLAVKNVRFITDLAGLTLTKKREFILTRKGKTYNTILNSSKLFSEIVKTYTTKFKWSFNDSLGNNNIGQYGFAYMLNLIYKYGDLPRNLRFYLDKYYKAFNTILVDPDAIEFHRNLFQKCFVLRTFTRFLYWFGLISISNESISDHLDYIIEKSDIFDSIFRFD